MPAPVKQDVHKRKVGRPGWVPSEKDLDQIQALAQRGVPKGTVAAKFGFWHTYWVELEKKFPEIRERYNAGLADGHSRAFAKLHEHIYEKGSERMLMWYLSLITGKSPDGVVNLNVFNNSTTNVQNNTNIQINFEKLNKDELKSLAQQCTLLLDSDNEKKD